MARNSTILDGDKSAIAEKRVLRILRARVVAAFRNLAKGIDRRTAQDRTWNFFSSGGAHWTRRLK